MALPSCLGPALGLAFGSALPSCLCSALGLAHEAAVDPDLDPALLPYPSTPRQPPFDPRIALPRPRPVPALGPRLKSTSDSALGLRSRVPLSAPP